MSPEYKAAYEAHNIAVRAYKKISSDHLAGEISDKEYFAGRKIYDSATKIFDVAFDKEAAGF
jgi:hypothetical protein